MIKYDLSEIVFSAKNETKIKSDTKKIIDSINKIGFKESAILFSIAESAKIGGKIGWINENQISKKIKDEIKNLEIGDFSEPIFTSGGIILLKVNDKKLEKIKIDKEKEINKIIQSEKNKFFNEYSLIYFKELENKAYVEKL